MSFTIFTVTCLTTPEATTEHSDAVREALKLAASPLDIDALVEVDERHDPHRDMENYFDFLEG